MQGEITTLEGIVDEVRFIWKSAGPLGHRFDETTEVLKGVQKLKKDGFLNTILFEELFQELERPMRELTSFFEQLPRAAIAASVGIANAYRTAAEMVDGTLQLDYIRMWHKIYRMSAQWGQHTKKDRHAEVAMMLAADASKLIVERSRDPDERSSQLRYLKEEFILIGEHAERNDRKEQAAYMYGFAGTIARAYAEKCDDPAKRIEQMKKAMKLSKRSAALWVTLDDKEHAAYAMRYHADAAQYIAEHSTEMSQRIFYTTCSFDARMASASYAEQVQDFRYAAHQYSFAGQMKLYLALLDRENRTAHLRGAVHTLEMSEQLANRLPADFAAKPTFHNIEHSIYIHLMLKELGKALNCAATLKRYSNGNPVKAQLLIDMCRAINAGKDPLHVLGTAASFARKDKIAKPIYDGLRDFFREEYR